MPLLGSFLVNSDLAHLWACCRSLRSYVVPVLVPRVSWDHRSAIHADVLPLIRILTHVHVGFGTAIRLPFSALPALTQVSLGDCFNQPLVAGVLPATLTQLNLGRNFNQQLVTGDGLRITYTCG